VVVAVVECGRWARGRRPPSVRIAARTAAESGAKVAAAGHAPAGIEDGGGGVMGTETNLRRDVYGNDH